MARLSMDDFKENTKQFSDVISSTWTDLLPHGCTLPELFRTGLPLDESLSLIGKKVKELSAQCKERCGCDCKSCYERWAKATNVLIEQQQLAKASKGDPTMLQWLGKARLKQTEPVPEGDIQPPVINIVGLQADQEKEIDALRKRLKALQKELPKETEGGDAVAGVEYSTE